MRSSTSPSTSLRVSGPGQGAREFGPRIGASRGGNNVLPGDPPPEPPSTGGQLDFSDPDNSGLIGLI